MKSILYGVLLSVVVFTSSSPMGVLAQEVQQLDYVIACGEDSLTGVIQTSDREQTTLSAMILGDDEIGSRGISLNNEDGKTSIVVDPNGYKEGWYSIVLVATMFDQSVEKRYEVYFENGTCDTAKSVQERIVQYAQEANEYFANNENTQKVPTQFLKTGLGERIDQLISATSNTFAMSKSPVFHNTPEWTTDPFALTYPSFEDHYALLPSSYRGAYAYLHFKSLLIPIVLPRGGESEDELLNVLDTGALLAPETKSLDVLGAVKMIYTHSLSFNDSPFSGVGAFLSVFAEQGDEFSFYINEGNGKFEQRTYTMTNRLQVDPDDTDRIKAFRSDGSDTIAMITCKDGHVLGSTAGREILFLRRNSEELLTFQATILRINENPSLQKQKELFDRYLRTEDMSDDALIKLVKKLELVEEETGNPLTAIATYGKYMASYNSLYDS